MIDRSGRQVSRQQAEPGAGELVQTDRAGEGGQDAGRLHPSVLQDEGAIPFYP